MKVPELLAELRSGNVRVWAEGERLRCRTPAGGLSPEMHARLLSCKGEILQFLRSAEKLVQTPRSIVPLQPCGARIPVFAVAGHNGDVFCYRALAQCLGNDQPFYGLQPPGLDGQSEPLGRIEDLAGYFAGQIRAFRPGRPCIIAGFCAGGAIAFELAQQLLELGEEIGFLALFACPFPTTYRLLPRMRQRLRVQVKRTLQHAGRLASLSFLKSRSQSSEQGREEKTQTREERPPEPDPVLLLRTRVQRATLAAASRYTPRRFAGCVSQFLPCREWLRSGYEPLLWRSISQHSEEFFGPDGCTSANMLREPHVPVFAQLFSHCYQNLVESGPQREKT